MKLEQYQAFAERVEVDAFIFVLKAHYCNNYSNNYEQGSDGNRTFYQLRHDDYLDKLDPNFTMLKKENPYIYLNNMRRRRSIRTV